MKKLVYTDPETGLVAVVHPAPEWLAIEGNTLEQCAKAAIPEGIPYRVVEEENIPADRVYRNAWTDEYDTPTVDVHIDKAKEIHINNLRLIRNNLLNNLDKDYNIAIEQNLVAKAKDIANKKQQLRDMPVNAKIELQNVHSIEELKQYTPSVLK